MKVLIIDDEPIILKMYEEIFRSGGFETLTAFDGEAGIKQAKENKPDYIMLDIIMPTFNGLDVLKKMKEDSEIKNIPVYLLTNLPAECSEEKAKSLGAAGYFVKAENDPKTVMEKIKSLSSPQSSS